MSGQLHFHSRRWGKKTCGRQRSSCRSPRGGSLHDRKQRASLLHRAVTTVARHTMQTIVFMSGHNAYSLMSTTLRRAMKEYTLLNLRPGCGAYCCPFKKWILLLELCAQGAKRQRVMLVVFFSNFVFLCQIGPVGGFFTSQVKMGDNLVIMVEILRFVHRSPKVSIITSDTMMTSKAMEGTAWFACGEGVCMHTYQERFLWTSSLHILQWCATNVHDTCESWKQKTSFIL